MGTTKQQVNPPVRKPRVRKQRAAGNRQSGFTQDQRASEAFVKSMAKEETLATVPAMREPKRQQPKAKQGAQKSKSKNQKRQCRLVPRLENWLALVSRPFHAAPVKCPVNYNPVPSFMTSLAHTTYTSVGQNIAAATTSQIAIYPGHGLASETASMDGVAYHARHALVNATTYNVGPYATTNAAMNAVISHQIAAGGARPVANTANDFPLLYDVVLPYTATASESGHSRWKLIGCGVRLENTTVLVNRGGNVVTVQPASAMEFGVAPATQNALASNPTYQITERANTGTLEIAWIPRPEDLAYWHTILTSEEAPAAALSPAGMFIFLNNTTAFTQTYALQMVFHWELAGNYLAAVSSASVHQPADKNVVEPAMDIARFTMPSASGILDAAGKVAATMSPLMGDHAAAALGGIQAARLALS